MTSPSRPLSEPSGSEEDIFPFVFSIEESVAKAEFFANFLEGIGCLVKVDRRTHTVIVTGIYRETDLLE